MTAERRLAPRAGGFTLIELMITVAVLAILASIATASYLRYVEKGTRADAKNALASASQILERCYSQNFTYLSCQVAVPATSPNGAYSITANIAATSYTLTASPVTGYVSSKDRQCTSFSLDQTGAQTSTGSATSSYCWTGHN